MLKNIVLSGGNTQYKNFAERLQAEVKDLAPADQTVSVIKTPCNEDANFVGAQKFAQYILNFENPAALWITKDDYEECGAESILNRKYC